MNQHRRPGKRRLAQEVEARFGLLPNFFCSETAAPGLIDQLWTFAKAAYLDSPLPSLFKERLFVYLSRFCAVRYCIVRHVGFLIGAGRPAGDVSALPETIEQVIALLTRPARGAHALEQALARLEALGGPANIPEPRTELESDLFDALTIVFLEPQLSERARNAVRRAFGEQTFETLVAYLAFIRTAHYWTETHPELAYEPDIAAVMQRHPDLAALLLDQTEAKHVAEGAALRQALAELTRAKQVLRQNETFQALLLKLSDALRPLGDALEIQRVACGVLREHLSASRVMYAEAFGHEDLHETAFDAEDKAHPDPIRSRIADFGAELALELRAGKPAWRDDVLSDRRLSKAEKSAAAEIGVRALANVPLVKNGRVVAMLGVHWKDRHTWSARESELLKEVAERTWAAAQRARAEAALRESEERLRLAQLRTGVGIWDQDLRTGRVTWTPELEAIFGLEPGSVKCYADFRDRVHPEDIERIEIERDVAVRRREIFNVEFRIIHSDGPARWILATGGAFYDEATGEPTRILGNNVDITERKQAELALAERSAQLALAEKAALVGSYAYDSDLEKMTVSKGYATMHGLPEGTTVTTRSEWRTRVHPDDLERMERFRTQNFGDKRHIYNVEYRIVLGGEVRWIESRSFISYDAEGQPRRVIGINIDVTERKQTETRLSDALAAGQVMAFEWDATTGLSQRSNNAANILGSEQGITGSSRNDFLRRVHPDDRARLKTRIRELRPDGASYAMSFCYVRPDGSPVWLEETAKGEFDAAGRLLRIRGLTRDITKRKNAELALAERNVQLALAAKAALVGSYAYDVKTGMLQFSEGYAAIYDFPEGTNEMTGSQRRALVHPEDLARLDSVRNQAIERRRGEFAIEYRNILPKRGVRWIESRSLIFYDSSGRPQRLVGVNIDITERKRAEETQRLLVAELNHRVKNVLATISAIIAQTQEASGLQTDFVTALNRRINSLARTHELLSESNWRGASLAEIVRREFAPYATGNAEARGPRVTLKAEATQAMATVLHELTTNAAKYGAFSDRAGRVSVQWRWLQNGSRDRLLIEWQETGGPAVLAPGQTGYGTSIIRELIPFELGGKVELIYAREGIRCQLEVPANWISRGGELAGERGALNETV
jgi:PAS domain S-box-containing protein